MSKYLDFVQLLSSGTTIVSLSLAWLAIYQQRRTAQLQLYAEKKYLLESLNLELSNLAPWAGHYPTKTVDFWWSNPDVQTWKMPAAKLIIPFNHIILTQASSSGIKMGLSSKLVEEILSLELSILAFENVLERQAQLVTANPTVSWELTEKLIAARRKPAVLSNAEYALMRQNFELNRILHVECIGNNDLTEANLNPTDRIGQAHEEDAKLKATRGKKRNIHTCYKSTIDLLKLEIATFEKEENHRPTLWINILNLIAIFLTGLGFLVLLSSFVYLVDSNNFIERHLFKYSNPKKVAFSAKQDLESLTENAEVINTVLGRGKTK